MKKNAASKTRKPALRIRREGFRAEITRSSSDIGSIYHYIVMREGERDILHWGQERSLKAARASVNDFLEHKLGRSPRKAI